MLSKDKLNTNFCDTALTCPNEVLLLRTTFVGEELYVQLEFWVQSFLADFWVQSFLSSVIIHGRELWALFNKKPISVDFVTFFLYFNFFQAVQKVWNIMKLWLIFCCFCADFPIFVQWSSFKLKMWMIKLLVSLAKAKQCH